jgi:beta-lactamase superfamily II metal-dependent hydrolase
VNRVSCLALTHGDTRQVGGVGRLRTLLPIQTTATSHMRFRSLVYRQILEGLETAPERHRRLNRGESVSGWVVLHPDRDDRFAQADDGAMVLFGRFQGTGILLLSDLGRSGQEALLERVPDLKADIVITGLPDRSEPLGDALLEAVRPKLIVVTDSEFPAPRRAGALLEQRLERQGVPVLYTRKAGAVTLSVRGGRWQARAMDGSHLSSPAPDERPGTGRVGR